MLLFGWGYLLAKLWHEPISAFKVYVGWALIRGIVLNAYLWANWPGYSDAYWITRGVTVILTGAVCGALWDALVGDFWPSSIFGGAVGAMFAIADMGERAWALPSDRLFGFAVCAACVLRLIWPYTSYTSYDRKSSYDCKSIALGLLVLTLFPAIAEMPYVLDLGGWLRFTPVYAGLACQVIWIYGHHHPASIVRTRSRSA